MIQPDDSIRVKIAGLQVDAKEFVRIRSKIHHLRIFIGAK
jgi:hypothetical protein